MSDTSKVAGTISVEIVVDLKSLDQRLAIIERQSHQTAADVGEVTHRTRFVESLRAVDRLARLGGFDTDPLGTSAP